jgi:hypothetical protein
VFFSILSLVFTGTSEIKINTWTNILAISCCGAEGEGATTSIRGDKPINARNIRKIAAMLKAGKTVYDLTLRTILDIITGCGQKSIWQDPFFGGFLVVSEHEN